MPLEGIVEPTTEFWTSAGLLAGLFVNMLFAEASGQRLVYGIWCVVFVLVIGPIGLVVMPGVWVVLQALHTVSQILR